MVPYVAYLRVYEPLAAFEDAEAERWAAYAGEQPDADDASLLQAEQRSSLAAVLTPPTLGAPGEDEDGAYVLHEGDDVFVCPYDTRLRSWLALAELIEELGDARLRLLAPGSLEHANPEFMRWRSENPDAVPHIRQQAWQVPPAWFLLVESAEREIYTVGGRASARYRTPIVRARRRCARAHSVVRRALDSEPVVDLIAGLGSWLESFHPHSRLELDYAGLARLLDVDPGADDSPDQVSEAVTALSEGDTARATACYQHVTDRWRTVRMAEHAN